MRCEKCDVEIICKTDICPLCHGKVTAESLPYAYAKPQKRKGRRQVAFSKWYLAIAATAILVVAVLSKILHLDNFWTVLTAGVFIYFYFCIRITVLSYKHLNMKIFGQTVALTALGILLDNIIKTKIYVFEIILPIIFLIAIVTVAINIMINLNNARSYLVSFFLIAILGVIPLIAVFIKDGLVWPSLIIASISFIVLCVMVIGARKMIVEELKRIFHR